jgi:histidinol dehydrogenase
MQTLRIRDEKGLQRLRRSLQAASSFSPTEERKVAAVIKAVRRGGDAALLRLARRFDGFRGTAKDLRVAPSAIKAAYRQVDRAFIKAVEASIANGRAFQQRLKARSWRAHLRPGVMLGQSIRPLLRVGLYVPGGEAPLVSTVIMTAVPAQVAGVPELALATPDRFGKGIDPRILVAADLAGVHEVLRLGGAQAVAAMAYGTRSIARVDKIVGPGSRWVSLAKKLVYGDCGIDMVAGPSEALVLADDSAPPAWVAADLLSQAEHAGDETAILVTTSEKLVKAVKAELARQLKGLPRAKVAASSLKKHGRIIIAKDLGLALRITDLAAPEHLQLMLRQPEKVLPRLRAAGAIFVGPFTPVALGDFLAGPSHVLPTGGTARFSNGLSVEDFVTKSSIIGYSRSALQAALPELEAIGGAEGLDAHVRSGQVRLAARR